MQLKPYQADTLAVLRHFLEEARIAGPRNAYEAVTREPEQAERLGGYAGAYAPLNRMPDVPYVCLRLPTATDRFYPDFVARLADGRLLVVEYKGAHIAEGSDTAEKRTIGALWQRQSGGLGLFVVVEKDDNGKDVWQQMEAFLRANSRSLC